MCVQVPVICLSTFSSSSSAIFQTPLFAFLFRQVEPGLNTTTILTIPLAELWELHRLGVDLHGKKTITPLLFLNSDCGLTLPSPPMVGISPNGHLRLSFSPSSQLSPPGWFYASTPRLGISVTCIGIALPPVLTVRPVGYYSPQ